MYKTKAPRRITGRLKSVAGFTLVEIVLVCMIFGFILMGAGMFLQYVVNATMQVESITDKTNAGRAIVTSMKMNVATGYMAMMTDDTVNAAFLANWEPGTLIFSEMIAGNDIFLQVEEWDGTVIRPYPDISFPKFRYDPSNPATQTLIRFFPSPLEIDNITRGGVSLPNPAPYQMVAVNFADLFYDEFYISNLGAHHMSTHKTATSPSSAQTHISYQDPANPGSYKYIDFVQLGTDAGNDGLYKTLIVSPARLDNPAFDLP